MFTLDMHNIFFTKIIAPRIFLNIAVKKKKKIRRSPKLKSTHKIRKVEWSIPANVSPKF